MLLDYIDGKVIPNCVCRGDPKEPFFLYMAHLVLWIWVLGSPMPPNEDKLMGLKIAHSQA